MRKGLDNGRSRGYVGWDTYWKKAAFPCDPISWLKTRLYQEIDELTVAIYEGEQERILIEAADIANFAMMIADLTKEA